MKTDYRFWEHNLNPITMKPDPYVINRGFEDEGEIQIKDENWVKGIEESKKKSRIKKVSKFW